MNYVRSNSLSLKYQDYHIKIPSDCQDIGIRKFEFVAKTQFLLITMRYRSQKMNQNTFITSELGTLDVDNFNAAQNLNFSVSRSDWLFRVLQTSLD